MAKKIKKKIIVPDPVYGSLTVAKFINCVMKCGKKTIARKNVYGAFEILKKKTDKEKISGICTLTVL